MDTMKIHTSISVLMLLFLTAETLTAQDMRGFVFEDTNQNLRWDSNEKGMEGVLVSNGREVVQTNTDGRWQLAVARSQTIFVIQPSGYRVPVNNVMVPQHYSVANAKDGEINFPLYKTEQSQEFQAILFGDTQARGLREVSFVMHDVVEECIGTGAKFGVALGDIVADDPKLFDEISAGIAQIGIPWYYIFGNHDHDRGARGNDGSDATFVKHFGPPTYAFEFGQVSFISLNNVFYKEEGGYKAHFTEDQIEFVRQYLLHVPENNLVVLMMHIPITACDNRGEMFRLLESRPYTLSIAGHTHQLANVFIDEKSGWRGDQPHHMFINGTVSGSWWCGVRDELGIPHATMNDGAPNGYALIKFAGNTYDIRYKAARRPEDYQMNIYLPEELPQSMIDTTVVLVNVFNGSEKSEVMMRLDNSEEWIEMEQTMARDPANMRLFARGQYLDQTILDKPLDEVFGWKMDFPAKSNHFWKANLPNDLHSGTHLVTVKTIDMFGKTYEAFRIFRITP